MIWGDKFNNKRDINYFIRTNESARGKRRASCLSRSTAPSVSSMAGARGERGVCSRRSLRSSRRTASMAVTIHSRLHRYNEIIILHLVLIMNKYKMTLFGCAFVLIRNIRTKI